MFRTNVPVTATDFFNRREELNRLKQLADALSAGAPQWLAVIGRRKVGKTSLLLELRRRVDRKSTAFVVIDTFEEQPLSAAVFYRYALRLVDAVFSAEAGVSLEVMSFSPSAYRKALQSSDRFMKLPPELRGRILELPERASGKNFINEALQLPEEVAEALDMSILVAWDEFQELAGLPKGKKNPEVFHLMRATWQHHNRVAYVISGSAPTMLKDLVLSSASPFFQHFDIMTLGNLPQSDALTLLIDSAPEGRPVPATVAERAATILGDHPFYLQLFGETLTSRLPPYDETSLQSALQDLLFSRTGRLALYFENEFKKLVGKSTFLAAVLNAVCAAPKTLTDISRQIGSPSGATLRYIERLGDAVARNSDGLYRIDDPVFGLWLQWRQPGGTVIPMTLVGDAAEKEVAFGLAKMGFDLVYQSRASRGSFDLLATRGHIQLGVQVKRTALPVRINIGDWKRMEADAERFGWRWVIATVDPKTDALHFLDHQKAIIKRQAVLNQDAEIENLLRWLD